MAVSSIILALAGGGIAAGAVLKFVGAIQRRADPADELHEMDTDLGFGIACPSCHSYATIWQGSFEKRRCKMCCLSFELKD